ncbi:MAG TPA: response regulator [Pyrinomonadaceae bacterium]|nr:response regulator [Pyrinomonadaceae bacterium]
MSERILIIDDEEHIRRMMRLTLEAARYAVTEAGDGLTGLEIFSDGSEWDLVVLDQRMPGIDGLETLRRLKAIKPGARVVMATAYASIELAVDAMKLGAADFVRKPMVPETLRHTVAVSLVRPSAQPLSFSGSSAASSLTVETITMNGFSILDPNKEDWQIAEQRRFTVVSPSGTRHEVLVHIDEEVVDYIERLARRSLPSESSFWTEAARRLLANYLWTKGEVPRTRKLVLNHLERDAILAAERWRD